MKRLFILLFSLISLSSYAKPLKVALITPRDASDLFWSPLRDYTNLAAKSFGIDLQTFYANGDHHEYVNIAKRAMTSKFDALIVMNIKDQASRVIKLAEKHNVPTVLITGGISPKYNEGKPGEKYKSWFAQILPDDIGCGSDLLKVLSESSKKRGRDKISLLAIEGNVADSGSFNRVRGLMNSIGKFTNVELLQTIPANWSPELAKKKYLELKKVRYPKIDAVWAASDGMALGVINAIKEEGLVPGKDVLVAGVDWNPKALESVKRGEMTANFGGQVFHGAWAIVLINDYFSGVKKVKNGITIRTKMKPLYKSNVGSYLNAIKKSNLKKFNFKQFSNSKKSACSHKYKFDVDKLIKL